MRVATIVGVILIIIGMVGLIWGGFELPRDREVVEVGPVEVEAETREDITIPWWLAGASLVGGIVLVRVGARKT